MKDFGAIEKMRYKTILEPRKRTALDGKSWWCVFDAENMRWSTLTMFGKYKTEKECQSAIDKYNYIIVQGTKK